MDIERRNCAIEIRDDGASPVIDGYAAVFYDEGSPGTEYVIDLMGEELAERISPKAFDETLSKPDPIHALFNHDTGAVLGYNIAGTLRLAVDDWGLRFTIDPPNTQIGRDVVEMVRRGDLGGASVGFIVEEQEFRKCKGRAIREIRKCKLRDVSAVAQPAYKATSVNARSLETAFKEWKEELALAEARKLQLLKARTRLAEIGFDPTWPVC